MAEYIIAFLNSKSFAKESDNPNPLFPSVPVIVISPLVVSSSKT